MGYGQISAGAIAAWTLVFGIVFWVFLDWTPKDSLGYGLLAGIVMGVLLAFALILVIDGVAKLVHAWHRFPGWRNKRDMARWKRKMDEMD